MRKKSVNDQSKNKKNNNPVHITRKPIAINSSSIKRKVVKKGGCCGKGLSTK